MAPDVPLSGARPARFMVGGWLVDPHTCRPWHAGVIQRLCPQLIDLRPGRLGLLRAFARQSAGDRKLDVLTGNL